MITTFAHTFLLLIDGVQRDIASAERLVLGRVQCQLHLSQKVGWRCGRCGGQRPNHLVVNASELGEDRIVVARVAHYFGERGRWVD